METIFCPQCQRKDIQFFVVASSNESLENEENADYSEIWQCEECNALILVKYILSDMISLVNLKGTKNESR